MARNPNGQGRVCKAFLCWFDSGPRLHPPSSNRQSTEASRMALVRYSFVLWLRHFSLEVYNATYPDAASP
jgi:hypothetical protein